MMQQFLQLALKAPITTAADDIHKYFFIVFSRKIKLDVASESSARQGIHMKNQALFSSKDKSKTLKCRLLQFLFGALGASIESSVYKGVALAYWFSIIWIYHQWICQRT